MSILKSAKQANIKVIDIKPKIDEKYKVIITYEQEGKKSVFLLDLTEGDSSISREERVFKNIENIEDGIKLTYLIYTKVFEDIVNRQNKEQELVEHEKIDKNIKKIDKLWHQ